MQATRVRGAIACAWIGGFFFLAGYSCQSDPSYTIELQEQSPNLFYTLAYLTLVGMIFFFYLIHQGQKSNPRIWWSRLLVAHFAILLLWIPVHLREITKRMEQSVENLGMGLGAEQVFLSHPLIGVPFLNRVHADDSRPNGVRWKAGDLLDYLQGREPDRCRAFCCRSWSMRRYFEPPPPRQP